MQINKLLCIIHQLVKVVNEKTANEDTIFITESLTQQLIHFHKLFFIRSKIS